MAEEVMECPFCGWKAWEGEYAMLLHMETLHPEGQSPFVPAENAGDGALGNSTECPVEGCGEVVPIAEMDDHLELHGHELGENDDNAATNAENSELVVDRGQDSGLKSAAPTYSRTDYRGDNDAGSASSYSQEASSSKQQKAIAGWRKIFNMASTPASSSKQRSETPSASSSETPSKRLGKAALGKHAHEDQMPEWLVKLLQEGGQVKCDGVIPVIYQLLQQCQSTRYAYLCHPGVSHVSKLKKEGGFCGYRNIQMASSYINAVKFKGYETFKGKIPSIFHIQDLIEAAWDSGINPQGREETGGIKGTRKYIGTPEALALYKILNIPCNAQGFKTPEPGRSEALLLDHIEAYFQSGVADPTQRIRQTNLPPIYFQHQGHSMTIVGLERLTTGARNLLVFDPMFKDSPVVHRLIGQKFKHNHPDDALKQYRRAHKYLKRYREFEILKLAAPPEGFPPLKS